MSVMVYADGDNKECIQESENGSAELHREWKDVWSSEVSAGVSDSIQTEHGADNGADIQASREHIMAGDSDSIREGKISVGREADGDTARYED